MTKEEILNRLVGEDNVKMLLADARLTRVHNGISYDMVREELVLEAMEQYAEIKAKQTAIAFAEWMAKYSLYDYGKHPYQYCERQQPNGGRGKIQTWTAEELYTLFTNSLNK